jgi:uncharacterized protein YbjT (DUF2867 family)
VSVVRRPKPMGTGRNEVQGDFTRDLSPGDWLPRVQGIDVVVNAVGILREQAGQRFAQLHEAAPIALFEASVLAGVRRVVQVSALGADEQARSAYHLSKKTADDFLLAQPLAAVVAQPSLVYGPGGTSAALFNTLASLPLLPLPGGGPQQVQPIHIDDLLPALLALIEGRTGTTGRVALVGPHAMSLREMLAGLRHGMALPPARCWAVPMPLVRAAAAAGGLFPGALLDRDTLQMLERGNTAEATATTSLLGRPPRPVSEFISPDAARSERVQAQLGWLLPLLRLSIACVWIVTGLLSFGLYPVDDSYDMLARLGITGALAPLMLYGAATFDLALGAATLFMKRRRLLWWAQIALMLGYMALITWGLPEYWLHPFGPILKNLPMLAAIGLLLALEDDTPWNT